MAAIGAAALAQPNAARADQPVSNRVVEENQRPGTRDWMLEKTQIEPATKYRSPWIEGYCSATSIRAGETVRFHVSTNPASPFTLEIFRAGYYGGDGGRSMKHLGEFAGTVQPEPEIGAKRLRNCQWSPCAELRIPDDWLSGVYLGKLTALASGRQSYLVFIVRDDRQADFIFQCSDHTWQAYNRWPNQFAIYDDGENPWYWGGDVQVGFNRPYGKYCQIFDAPLSLGSGEWLLWEFPLAYWMESLGYDVSYISNRDTHRDGAGLLRAKGFLSVGHDEYWTIEMFQNVKAAIDKGVNAAFLSGNAVCYRVDFDDRPRAFERVGVFGPPGATRRIPRHANAGPRAALRQRTDGRPKHRLCHRRRRLDLPTARPLAICRNGHESRRLDSRVDRLGMAWRPGPHSGPGSRCQRTDAKQARPIQRRHLHGDHLSRPARQLCVQRRHDLVGRWSQRAPRLCSAKGLHRTAGARRARAPNDAQPAGENAWLSETPCLEGIRDDVP